MDPMTMMALANVASQMLSGGQKQQQAQPPQSNIIQMAKNPSVGGQMIDPTVRGGYGQTIQDMLARGGI